MYSNDKQFYMYNLICRNCLSVYNYTLQRHLCCKQFGPPETLFIVIILFVALYTIIWLIVYIVYTHPLSQCKHHDTLRYFILCTLRLGMSCDQSTLLTTITYCDWVLTGFQHPYIYHISYVFICIMKF